MTPPVADERVAAESWFLRHGLPAVLRPGRLVARVWARSAPAVAALAAMMLSSVLIVLVTGQHTIDIDGTPTRTEWFALVVVVLILPAAAVTGWLVSRISTTRDRDIASTVAVVLAVLGAIFGGPSPYVVPDLLLLLALIVGVLVCTATGIGSVMGWAVRVTMSNLAETGALFIRALPVVLLTVLVFFNTYVWLMAATVSRARLWLALLFLFFIAAAFLISSTLERVGPILQPDAKNPDDAQRLAGTPFAAMPDRPRRVPLSRPERVNVVLVLALSQLVQVLTVAAVTGAIFFVLGLILLSPKLLDEWTRGGATDGQILGMTFPVPQALIQVSMFLAAMTFMYVAARAVGEPDQRSRFLNPLVDDLRLTLAARDRYRAYTAGR